jgi:hypothetical protein
MSEIGGANMDIDFFPAEGVSWEVGKCPWNEEDGENCHKCAEKGVSICKYFEGIKKIDTVLCSYGEEK